MKTLKAELCAYLVCFHFQATQIYEIRYYLLLPLLFFLAFIFYFFFLVSCDPCLVVGIYYPLCSLVASCLYKILNENARKIGIF